MDESLHLYNFREDSVRELWVVDKVLMIIMIILLMILICFIITSPRSKCVWIVTGQYGGDIYEVFYIYIYI